MITTTFNKPKVTTYTWHSSHEKPSPQSILALIAVNKVGSIIGKDKMAVNVALLFVFDAMAELKLSTVEMPKLPRNNTT